MNLQNIADNRIYELLSDARHLARAKLQSNAPADLISTEGFSLGRLLKATAEGRALVGREKEVAESASRLAGEPYFNGDRLNIPFNAMSRAMGSVGGSKGGYMVGVDTTTPFDVLRPWSVVASSGVTAFSDLKNNLQLPRVGTAVTSGWLGPENTGGPSETPPILGAASLTPHTAIALIKFSMQLVRQGEIVDQFLNAQLLRAVGELLDTAFFAGTGGAQPLGLLNTQGVGAQSGTSLAHAGILAMREAVLNAGGREKSLQWVGAPAVQKLLGSRERATGGGRFLWDDDGILGLPASATKTAPAGVLACGDFGQSVVGIFGPGVRIDIDPSQDFNSAGLVARVLLLCDCTFPQPAAFSVATSVT